MQFPSVRRSTALALMISVLSPVTLLCETKGYWVTGAVLVAGYLAVVLYCVIGKRGTLTAMLIVGYFFLFHEYGPNPYEEGFVGFARLGNTGLLMIVAVFCLKYDLSLSAFVVVSWLSASTVVGILNGTSLRTVGIEAPFAVVLVFGLVARWNRSLLIDLQAVSRFLFRLFLTIPIQVLIQYSLGLYDYRQWSLIFFYGHEMGILMIASAIHVLSPGRDRLGAVHLALFVLSVAILAPALQTSELVLTVLVMVALISLSRLRFRQYAVAGVFLCGVAGYVSWAVANASAGSWIYLKAIQVVRSYSGDVSRENNSFAIRYAEASSLVDQFTTGEVLAGGGVGRSYEAVDGVWPLLNLHESTFPAEQLEERVFTFIHEPVVMIFKWIGIVGLLFASALVFVKVRRTSVGVRPHALSFGLLFVFLFSASASVGLLTMLLFVMFAHRLSTTAELLAAEKEPKVDGLRS